MEQAHISMVEPKKVFEALEDPDWLEVICRRIGIFDRRWGPSSLGLPEGVKESVVKVVIVHVNYPASALTTAARSYVLL